MVLYIFWLDFLDRVDFFFGESSKCAEWGVRGGSVRCLSRSTSRAGAVRCQPIKATLR